MRGSSLALLYIHYNIMRKLLLCIIGFSVYLRLFLHFEWLTLIAAIFATVALALEFLGGEEQ